MEWVEGCCAYGGSIHTLVIAAADDICVADIHSLDYYCVHKHFTLRTDASQEKYQNKNA